MAVREFSDSNGMLWRAWDVTPESIHPMTRAEDYLDACYREGWVVFESGDGKDKRRYCPPPAGWSEFSVDELEDLLARAEPVSQRPLARKSADAAPRKADDAPRKSSMPAQAVRRESAGLPTLDLFGIARTFEYPRGRKWVVCLYEHIGKDGRARPVLRFTTGIRTTDADHIPPDWADMEEEDLIELLRESTPRPKDAKSAAPHRRHGDQRGDLREER